jgi:hypothetical protein
VADTNISAKIEGGAVQNTGNPVFDATVNLLMNRNYSLAADSINGIHKALLDIYEQEPLRNKPKPKSRSLQQMKQDAEEIGAR